MYEWRSGRCPCCRKKTRIVLGLLLNETAHGWDNIMNPEHARRLARAGTCPWCGRQTTIITAILFRRFEPTLRTCAKEFFW